MTDKRVTVDFDSKSYYLDGKYWESWDNYGEEMADAINELLNEVHKENQQLKCALLFYLDLAVSDGSGNWNEQMEKWCNILLNCSYNEAKSKYGEYEYSEKWELGE